MFTLEQLLYLSTVARFNSIKLAAEELNVAPSTISMALHKVEKTANISLLTRTSHGITLTETALEIVPIANRILNELDNINDIILKPLFNSISEQPLNVYVARGSFMGAFDQLFSYFKNKGFSANFPDILCGNDKYLEFVNQDTNSILINYFAEPSQELLNEFPNVEYLKINSAPPCVICSDTCKLIPPEKTELTIAEALKLPYLMFNEGLDLALRIFEMLEEHGKIHFIKKSSNLAMIVTLLLQGVGVSVCSNSYLSFDTDISTPEDTGFRILPIKCDMRLTLMLCYNRNASPERKQLFQKIAKDLR